MCVSAHRCAPGRIRRIKVRPWPKPWSCPFEHCRWWNFVPLSRGRRIRHPRRLGRSRVPRRFEKKNSEVPATEKEASSSRHQVDARFMSCVAAAPQNGGCPLAPPSAPRLSSKQGVSPIAREEAMIRARVHEPRARRAALDVSVSGISRKPRARHRRRGARVLPHRARRSREARRPRPGGRRRGGGARGPSPREPGLRA
jgi:hypothetical protein